MKKNTNMLIIPDIHGRDFWKEEVKKTKDPIIFLGDYTDPYPSEGFDPKVIPGYIKEIIEIPEATRLLGNHDLSYILP
jgi:predicted phosphodiesterase